MPAVRGPLVGAHTVASASPTPRDEPTANPSGRRFEADALAANLALVDLVTVVADRRGASVGQVALAWLLAQRPWIVPIPGTRRLSRLDENVGATALELTAEDVAELDAASRSVVVQGDRYPEVLQRMVDR